MPEKIRLSPKWETRVQAVMAFGRCKSGIMQALLAMPIPYLYGQIDRCGRRVLESRKQQLLYRPSLIGTYGLVLQNGKNIVKDMCHLTGEVIGILERVLLATWLAI